MGITFTPRKKLGTDAKGFKIFTACAGGVPLNGHANGGAPEVIFQVENGRYTRCILRDCNVAAELVLDNGPFNGFAMTDRHVIRDLHEQLKIMAPRMGFGIAGAQQDFKVIPLKSVLDSRIEAGH